MTACIKPIEGAKLGFSEREKNDGIDICIYKQRNPIKAMGIPKKYADCRVSMICLLTEKNPYCFRKNSFGHPWRFKLCQINKAIVCPLLETWSCACVTYYNVKAKWELCFAQKDTFSFGLWKDFSPILHSVYPRKNAREHFILSFISVYLNRFLFNMRTNWNASLCQLLSTTYQENFVRCTNRCKELKCVGLAEMKIFSLLMHSREAFDKALCWFFGESQLDHFLLILEWCC